MTLCVLQNHRMFALGVQITELCAPGCLICIAQGHAQTPRSMTPDTFERVLLEARALGISRVVLTGGEPLVHEELNALVDLIEAIDEEQAPLLEVRLREALSLVEPVTGRRCGGCREVFARGLASLPGG